MAVAAVSASQVPVAAMLDEALRRFDRFSALLDKAADRAGYFENSVTQANGSLIEFGKSVDDANGKLDKFVAPLSALADKATSAGNAIEKLCKNLSACCAQAPAPGKGGDKPAPPLSISPWLTFKEQSQDVLGDLTGTAYTAAFGTWFLKWAKLLKKPLAKRWIGRFSTGAGWLSAASDSLDLIDDVKEGHYLKAAGDVGNIFGDIALMKLLRNGGIPPGRLATQLFGWGRGAGGRMLGMGSRVLGLGSGAAESGLLSMGAAESGLVATGAEALVMPEMVATGAFGTAGAEVAGSLAVGSGIAAGEGGLLAALGLAGPVGWTIAGLLAVGTAGYLAYKNWNSVKKWAAEPHPILEGVAGALVPGGDLMFHGVTSLIKDPKPLQDMIKPVADEASKLWKESEPARKMAYGALPFMPGGDLIKAGIDVGSYAMDHPKETMDAVSSTVDMASSGLGWLGNTVMSAVIPGYDLQQRMLKQAEQMAQQQMQGPMRMGPGIVGPAGMMSGPGLAMGASMHGGPGALNGPVLATGPVLLANPEKLAPKGPPPKPTKSSTDIRVLFKNLPPGAKVSSSTRGDGVVPQIGHAFGH